MHRKACGDLEIWRNISKFADDIINMGDEELNHSIKGKYKR